ncbi:kinase-like domain-containing protein, partial [Neohortaea acidophila]
MKEGRTGDVRAVKVLHRPTASNEGKIKIDIGRELEAVARFSRPEYARWFVRSSGWFESDDDIFIAMELMPYGNLQQYIGQGLPENEVKVLIAQVLKGLQCMHAAGYTHRDLKPANLLVAQKGPAWHVKIADFGLSKSEDLSSLHTNFGTWGYVAPEVLGLQIDDAEDASRPSYTNAVDIWAIGVIAFVLLTGGLPFPSQDHRPLARYVRGQAPFPADVLRAKNISAAGCAFVESLMAPNPLMRPSAESSADNVWL